MQHYTTAAGGFYGNLRIFYSPDLDFSWNILFWFQLLDVLFQFPSVRTVTNWFKDDKKKTLFGLPTFGPLSDFPLCLAWEGPMHLPVCIYSPVSSMPKYNFHGLLTCH